MKRILTVAAWLFPCALIAGGLPHYEVDSSWPKPLPKDWHTGLIGGVCTDSHDHILVLNRHMPVDEDYKTLKQAPPMILFDMAGNVVSSWGDPKLVPTYIHGCVFDSDNNVWIGGRHDGMIQKYSHDGKLLLQIGMKGVYDSSDGSEKAAALNSSQKGFYHPAGIAIDKANGDIYVADGYGNRRVVVFDKTGKFLRQWGKQATDDEARAGVGGAFAKVVHCVVIGNDGLVYVCDRNGDRVQVFDKMGKFQRNIWMIKDKSKVPDPGGTMWAAFSLDPQQKYMYVIDGVSKGIVILDHKNDQVLSKIAFTPDLPSGGHTLAIDSKGDMYFDRDSDHMPRAKTDWGRRIQRLKPVTN